MWLVRAVVHLLVLVVAAVAITLGVAALWAVGHGGSFAHAFTVACFVFGAFLLLMAGAGQQRSSTLIETSGRLPGMPAWMNPAETERSLSTAAVFVIAGVVLIALGALQDAFG